MRQIHNVQIWDRFKTAFLARETMLQMFAAIQSTTPSDMECTCVDASPVFDWFAAAPHKDVTHLVCSVPIKPPVKVLALGIVCKLLNEGQHGIIMAIVSRNESENILQLTLQDSEGRTVQCTHVYYDDLGKFVGIQRATKNGAVMDAIPDDMIAMLLAAMAMFHVRNIGTREHAIPRHIRRRLQKDGFQGPMIYRTLTLRPFTEDAEMEKRNRMPTGERALHLVRGHFATYTSAAPMLGRYIGTFWRPEHLAGNGGTGNVRKTYTFDPSPV